MADQKEETSAGSSGDRAVPMDDSTRLSIERTMLSHERTLMSWVRTATSLITFGFTIYKFFEFEGGNRAQQWSGQFIRPRGFAMLMIAVGLLGLLLAAVENWQHRSHLRATGFKAPYSFTTLMALLISVLGILALLATIFRW